MNRFQPGKLRSSGFTLVEIAVATAVFALTTGIIYHVLTTGITLSAKNSAVNLAHQQTRAAIDRLTRDIHASVSAPVLLDQNLVALPNSVGPAPGIAFMLQASPNLLVSNTGSVPDYAASVNTIQVSGLGSFVPKVGQRLVVPTHQIEADITAVSGNTLTLSSNLGVSITVTNSPSNFNIVAYIADVVEYGVVNQELRYYPSASSTAYTVVARNQMNPNPFGLAFGAIQ
jgi:prepilin-type N-terminal cleavage/methylation domain-containing protein